MNYIIGPRGSGRTTYILQQRERTGGRIYTSSNVEAQALKRKALELGCSPDGIEAIFFDKNNWRGASFTHREFVYFDNFEQMFKDILGEYMCYARGLEFIQPVLAITTNDKTIELNPNIPTSNDILFRKELLERK